VLSGDAGEVLLNGIVYTSWASHCDRRPYTGWIIGYNAQTLAQASVLNIIPNGNSGSIWMPAGLAADNAGNIYCISGNGTLDTTLTSAGFPINGDFGNSAVKLGITNGALSVLDYFAPSNTLAENAIDQDLGSGAALVLPEMLDAQNQPRHLVVGAGKDSRIYLLDTADMGKFHTNTNAIYQQVNGAITGGVWGMPAYFNGTLYYGAVGDRIKAFPFQNARLGTRSSQTSNTFVYPGATPSISANGTANGILWGREIQRLRDCTPMQPQTWRSSSSTQISLACVISSGPATSSSPPPLPAPAFTSARLPASAYSACWTNRRSRRCKPGGTIISAIPRTWERERTGPARRATEFRI
jgi:hypothetical protein